MRLPDAGTIFCHLIKKSINIVYDCTWRVPIVSTELIVFVDVTYGGVNFKQKQKQKLFENVSSVYHKPIEFSCLDD